MVTVVGTPPDGTVGPCEARETVALALLGVADALHGTPVRTVFHSTVLPLVPRLAHALPLASNAVPVARTLVGTPDLFTGQSEEVAAALALSLDAPASAVAVLETHDNRTV